MIVGAFKTSTAPVSAPWSSMDNINSQVVFTKDREDNGRQLFFDEVFMGPMGEKPGNIKKINKK